MATRVKVPRPVSGGVMLSYKCSAVCRHCMYACSPKWEADWMTEEALERLLSRLVKSIASAPWGPQVMSLNYGIHLTGGEPFLNYDLLLRATEMAEKTEIPSTFVETNCSWCIDDEATQEKLQCLKAAGLKGILVSVNPFYTEYVPFERTERCIRISREVFGRNLMVYQEAYYHRFKRLGIQEKLPLEDYLEMTRSERLAEHVEIFLQGRAACQLREFYPKYPASAFFGEPCRPSFLRSWHNHFDNYGNFVPGYCGGISLGNWEELDALVEEGIDLETHPVLRHLIEEDVRGLLHFAKDFGYQEYGGGYLSKCDLCLDIRRFLVTQGDFEELRPKGFYEHLDANG
jgi:hypothetical protein